MNITESEILDALRDAISRPGARPEGALTSGELSEAMGLGRSVIKTRLSVLVRSGRMECVWIKAEDMTGRVNRVPAYRMVAPKKKAKR